MAIRAALLLCLVLFLIPVGWGYIKPSSDPYPYIYAVEVGHMELKHAYRLGMNSIVYAMSH